MTTENTDGFGPRRSGMLLALLLGAMLATLVAVTGVTREAQAAYPGGTARSPSRATAPTLAH